MPSHPRVSILGLNFPPESTGNAPYTGGLAKGLHSRGYHVSVDTAHPHYPEWRVREGFGGWYRADHVDGVEVRRRRHYIPRPPRGMRRLVSEVSFGARLLTARWGRPQVVIAVSPALFSSAFAVLRARLTLRRPTVITWVQDIYTLGLAETGEGNKLVARVTRWVESRTFRASDRVVVIHDRFAQFLIKDLGVRPEKIRVVRNWTHLPPSQVPDKLEARRQLGWPTDVAIAVHTGNMGAKQGLENIIDAARKADEGQAALLFILVGDGGERENLEQLAEGVERVLFVDPLEAASYPLALASADVLLVNEKPGVASMAVPSKLTSYFDAGRPVVAATDPDGITASEVRAADAGTIVNAGDPTALLQAVVHLTNDPISSAEFGTTSRRYRETVLDESHAIDSWAAIISEADAGRRHPAPPRNTKHASSVAHQIEPT